MPLPVISISFRTVKHHSNVCYFVNMVEIQKHCVPEETLFWSFVITSIFRNSTMAKNLNSSSVLLLICRKLFQFSWRRKISPVLYGVCFETVDLIGIPHLKNVSIQLQFLGIGNRKERDSNFIFQAADVFLILLIMNIFN